MLHPHRLVDVESFNSDVLGSTVVQNSSVDGTIKCIVRKTPSSIQTSDEVSNHPYRIVHVAELKLVF